MDGLKRIAKLEVDIDSNLVASVRAIACSQGRDVAEVIDEALREFLRKSTRDSSVQPDLMAAHGEILERCRDVFGKLAE